MQFSTIEVLHQGAGEHPVPTLQRRQLLRSLAQRLEEGRDLAAGALYPGGFGMRVTDGDAGLSAMAGEAGRGMQQERATGDGLGMLTGIGQARA